VALDGGRDRPGVRTRLISSRDAVESCLRRIELTNPAVNALAEVCMEEFRRLMPLVEQLGNEGMRRAAATYFAAAERWGDRRPTSARTSTGTPAAGRWCGGCRSRRRTTRCC
jgi:Asp-tRNA(Asn)/Glu-tRNA(Gln) amidotransferase A subunit family amidase